MSYSLATVPDCKDMSCGFSGSKGSQSNNGTMKKVHKSKMIEKLHTEPMEAVPEKYIALVDMGFLWRLATPSAEDREKPDGSVFTWGDYADKLFSIAVA